jgi:4-diphosphocytidyl-2-C-methyl-D-erythritol kinase
MLDKIKIFAPAKLNLFLKVLSRRADGYHIVRSGITFINLFDEVEIKKSDKMSISYTGLFKPKGNFYKNCIIRKTLKFLKIDKKLNLNIKITKNIPTLGGLGSASTNAAALIQGLDAMQIINKKKPDCYVNIGADIPCFLFKKNCLVTGIGEIINLHPFPKYYFLLVKPRSNNSTKEMFNKLDHMFEFLEGFTSKKNIKITDGDTGNDFEKIVFKENKEIENIICFLENLENVVFSRMTGSGTCCYAVFEKKEYALKAKNIFKFSFSGLWCCVCENNTFDN